MYQPGPSETSTASSGLPPRKPLNTINADPRMPTMAVSSPRSQESFVPAMTISARITGAMQTASRM